jgi:hypothetical protein
MTTTETPNKFPLRAALDRLKEIGEDGDLSAKEVSARLSVRGAKFSERRIRAIMNGGVHKGHQFEPGLIDRWTADELACKGLRVHPSDVWPEEWRADEGEEDLADLLTDQS